MDRKQKIIVSVVGIFIVLLALVGITYGYFLTQIQGNTNTNSISITTANLRLVYDDGTTEILVKNNIVPDTTVATKDFTVTNEGDSAISEYQVYLENVINDFSRTQDVKLKVTCTYKKKDNSTGTCIGYDSTYPKTNTKLISNSIDVGEVHTYALSVVYEEANLDQSNDMGKTLKGKVQIYDPKDIVTLTGTVNITNPVTNATYFVELQSIPKTSEIINNTYTIPGVEPSNHTLYIKYRLNGSITTVASKAITVSKGSTASISSDGTSIVINDKTESTEVDVSVSGTTITLSGGEIVEVEGISDFIVSEPDLLNNSLTPIVWDEAASTWKVADASSTWYNYSEQKWANATTVSGKNLGDPVNLEHAAATYVWIPRFEYKIEGQYGTHTDGTSGTAELPGEIEVNFIPSTQTTASAGYKIHPAFTFGTEELDGIWVGKFETSGDVTAGAYVQPNTTPIGTYTVSTYFILAQGFANYLSDSTNVDAHMMKNSEWGAVAYLSQSAYGKYGNSSYTGASKEIAENKSNTSDDDYYIIPLTGYSGESTPYTIGVDASTTGTIYGIYDMAGGANELVMGYREWGAETWGDAECPDYGPCEPGYFEPIPDSKYFDSYTFPSESSDATTACNGGICYGHALSETQGWYGDGYAFFQLAQAPWIYRGVESGFIDGSGNNGIFTVGYYNTDAYWRGLSFRSVLVME